MAHRGFGCRLLPAEYYSRYRVPLFHTESHRASATAVEWLSSQWDDIIALRNAGIPVMGFTWFSLTDQIDWQAFREEQTEIHAVGLYDLERRIHPAGLAFKELIAANRELAATPGSSRSKEA
jgi:beta-glucosidase/6-phospho-beta-glucosidase/beta-galactosidase